MCLKSGPLFTNCSIHNSLVVTYVVVRVWQLFHQEFIRELFITVLWVDDNTPHSIVSSLFSKFFYTLLLNFICLCYFFIIFAFVYTFSSPGIPSFFDFCNVNFLSEFVFNFSFFFFFELFYDSVGVLGYEQVFDMFVLTHYFFRFSIETFKCIFVKINFNFFLFVSFWLFLFFTCFCDCFLVFFLLSDQS